MQPERFNSETLTKIFHMGVYRTPALLMQKLDNLIEQHFMEQRSPDFYSNALAYLTRTLNEITHAERGKTIFMMIQDRVFNEAKYLLSTTAMPVKATSFVLGFEDPAYFGRFFKKMSGIPPREFRKIEKYGYNHPLTPPFKGGVPARGRWWKGNELNKNQPKQPYVKPNQQKHEKKLQTGHLKNIKSP